MSNRTVFITPSDNARLRRALESIQALEPGNHAHLSTLADDLEEARLVPAGEVPGNVVALNSRVRVRNLRSGKESVYTLVFPKKADARDDKVSVLAPMGSALLGHKVGDLVEYLAPGGTTQIEIVDLVSPRGAIAA